MAHLVFHSPHESEPSPRLRAKRVIFLFLLLSQKPSRIPDQNIAFVQHAFAFGADDRLDERWRIFLTHAVTKPHLTLQGDDPRLEVTRP
jgi:hypothetical protein